MVLYVLESLGIHIWITCKICSKLIKRQKTRNHVMVLWSSLSTRISHDILRFHFWFYRCFNHSFGISLTVGYHYETLFCIYHYWGVWKRIRTNLTYIVFHDTTYGYCNQKGQNLTFFSITAADQQLADVLKSNCFHISSIFWEISTFTGIILTNWNSPTVICTIFLLI